MGPLSALCFISQDSPFASRGYLTKDISSSPDIRLPTGHHASYLICSASSRELQDELRLERGKGVQRVYLLEAFVVEVSSDMLCSALFSSKEMDVPSIWCACPKRPGSHDASHPHSSTTQNHFDPPPLLFHSTTSPTFCTFSHILAKLLNSSLCIQQVLLLVS